MRKLKPFMATNMVSKEVRFYATTLEAEKDGFRRQAIAACLRGRSNHHLGWKFEFQTAEATPVEQPVVEEPVQITLKDVHVDDLIHNTFEVRNPAGGWIFRGTYEECVDFMQNSLSIPYFKKSAVKSWRIVRIP